MLAQVVNLYIPLSFSVSFLYFILTNLILADYRTGGAVRPPLLPWVERWICTALQEMCSLALYTLPYDNVTEGFIWRKKEKKNLCLVFGDVGVMVGGDNMLWLVLGDGGGCQQHVTCHLLSAGEVLVDVVMHL